MSVTVAQPARPWTVPASDIADATGIPLKLWREKVGRNIKNPRLRRGRRYTDLALLLAETSFELTARFGGGAHALADRTLTAIVPHLIESWERTKRGDAVPFVVIVRNADGEEILRFELGSIVRTLARIAGDREALDESLRDLRDAAYQQRTDGTYDRLEALAASVDK
jgi:hypothetical protein